VETRAPRPLSLEHDLAHFNCGEETLDSWLREQAWASRRTASTYVIADPENRVAGYYCLSSGALMRRSMPGSARSRRGLPDPIPVILLGRLAIDQRYQGHGLGADLLQDAVIRAIDAAHQIAAYGLLVHALNESSLAFYQRWGFTPCRDHPLTLLLPLNP